MIEIALLILCLLAPSAISQQSSSAPTCQQIMNQTVFNRCTRAVLRVKDTQGAQIASDQVGACYTQQGNSTAYQKCLCAKTSAILNCYDLWCLGDAGQVVQSNYQLLFCQAFHSGQVFTAMPTLTGIPAAPTDDGNAEVPDFTPAVPRNYGSPSKSAAEAFRLSTLIMPIIAATLIMSLIFL